jgi:hypothetical protein
MNDISTSEALENGKERYSNAITEDISFKSILEEKYDTYSKAFRLKSDTEIKKAVEDYNKVYVLNPTKAEKLGFRKLTWGK